MKAVILAAGKGVRLNGISGDNPKCLLNVGGKSLIERQLIALRSIGILDIICVVGCGAERVREACGPDCQYILNDQYDTTNNLYSLWLAREHLEGGFIVLNADVLFDRKMLVNLIDNPAEDALLIEPQNGHRQKLGDEEMKVVLEKGSILQISKGIDPAIAHGESVGIAKFGKSGASLIIKHMNRLILERKINEWLPKAFQEFSTDRTLMAVPTTGLPWIEIDFPSDYYRACDEIVKKIDDVPSNI